LDARHAGSHVATSAMAASNTDGREKRHLPEHRRDYLHSPRAEGHEQSNFPGCAVRRCRRSRPRP
jgi:hypothetical protein